MNPNACELYGCVHKPDKGSTWCIGHRKHFGTPLIKATQKKIPPKSKKRIEEDKVYKKIVKELMEVSNKCVVKSPECTGTGSGLHHLQKRCGKNITDKKNLVVCCTGCNGFIEKFPSHPISKKYTVSRFAK